VNTVLLGNISPRPMETVFIDTFYDVSNESLPRDKFRQDRISINVVFFYFLNHLSLNIYIHSIHVEKKESINRPTKKRS